MSDTIPQKQCTGECKRVLPATTEYFHSKQKGKYNLHSTCKECRNKERHIHYQTNKQQENAYSLQYYYSHREEQSAQTNNWKQSHKEEEKTRHAEYRQTHKEQNATHCRNRRSRKMDNGGTHTLADIQTQYNRQKGRCYYAACGYSKLSTNYHVDHIVPLSKGGSNGSENLVIACPTCNRKKKDKLPHEWIEGGRLF